MAHYRLSKLKLKRVLLVLLLIPILGFSYAYYEARSIRLVKYSFQHSEIPPSFDGKKIIFISDIHCNIYFPPQKVRELVSRVNSLQPDIIILAGDNTQKDSIYSTPYFEEIGKLRAEHGVYSVLGNHDFWEDPLLIQQGLIDCGFQICDNQSFWIHEGSDSIKIGGVGDLWEDKQILGNTTDDINKSHFCLLISHNPDYAEKLETDKVDLMISGHTHGGQVTLFGLYAPVMPTYWRPDLPSTGQKYRYGWKQKENTKIYISTGIGMGNFPFRFFAPPEIVEITLESI